MDNYYISSTNIGIFPISKRESVPNARQITEGSLSNLLSSFAGKRSFTISVNKLESNNIDVLFVLAGRLVHMLIPGGVIKDQLDIDIYAHTLIAHHYGTNEEYNNIMYGGIFDTIQGDDTDGEYKGIILNSSEGDKQQPFTDIQSNCTHVFHKLFHINEVGDVSIPTESLPSFMHVNGGTLDS